MASQGLYQPLKDPFRTSLKSRCRSLFSLAGGKRTRTQGWVPATDSELRAREPGSHLLEAGWGSRESARCQVWGPAPLHGQGAVHIAAPRVSSECFAQTCCAQKCWGLENTGFQVHWGDAEWFHADYRQGGSPLPKSPGSAGLGLPAFNQWEHLTQRKHCGRKKMRFSEMF